MYEKASPRWKIHTRIAVVIHNSSHLAARLGGLIDTFITHLLVRAKRQNLWRIFFWGLSWRKMANGGDLQTLKLVLTLTLHRPWKAHGGGDKISLLLWRLLLVLGRVCKLSLWESAFMREKKSKGAILDIYNWFHSPTFFGVQATHLMINLMQTSFSICRIYFSTCQRELVHQISEYRCNYVTNLGG